MHLYLYNKFIYTNNSHFNKIKQSTDQIWELTDPNIDQQSNDPSYYQIRSNV